MFLTNFSPYMSKNYEFKNRLSTAYKSFSTELFSAYPTHQPRFGYLEELT
jgi:hypothetical protein